MISEAHLAQLRALIETILEERGFPKLPSAAAQRQKRYRERINCGAMFEDSATGGDKEGRYYVYLLVDPTNQKPFYVGKGSSSRVFCHVPQALSGEDSLKAIKIREIVSAGAMPIIKIDSRWRIEMDAYERERELIDTLPDLLNTHVGWSSNATSSKRNGSKVKIITNRHSTTTDHNTSEAWANYAEAYRARYGTNPVRNAKVNGQLVQLAKRVGEDAAPMASWYVSHGAARYVQSGHSIGLLLMDAEKLHTEWQTGRRITATQAQQSDRTQATGDVFHKLISEVKRDGKIA